MTDNIRPLLLVEDNTDDVTFVQRALKNGRIANPLTVARTAAEAREAIGRMTAGDLAVLAIVDIALHGGESGLEFIDWLRQQPAPAGEIPVVMFTVSIDRTEEARATKMGALAFLRKPITDAALSDAVHSVGLNIHTIEDTDGAKRVIDEK